MNSELCIFGGLVVALVAFSAFVVHITNIREAQITAACAQVGMEMVYFSESYGRHNATFYMCRAADGTIHALPEGKP